jgi:hypothetical protein
MSGILEAVDFAHAREGAAYMRNGDGAADNEGDVEGVYDVVALPAFFATAHEMVGDAVVATENGAGDQTEQLLGLAAERTGLVGLMVECEEPLDAEMAAAEDLFVEVGAKFLEVVEAVGHGSSGVQTGWERGILPHLWSGGGTQRIGRMGTSTGPLLALSCTSKNG